MILKVVFLKKMLVDIAGESHSEAYRDGMDDLETQNSVYQVITFSGSFPGVTDTDLAMVCFSRSVPSLAPNNTFSWMSGLDRIVLIQR